MKQFDTDSETSPLSEDYKPTYIHEQHNTNCQQFFGPITNCTFTMPAASASHAQTPKSSLKKGKRFLNAFQYHPPNPQILHSRQQRHPNETTEKS